jgi:hypothetical protein
MFRVVFAILLWGGRAIAAPAPPPELRVTAVIPDGQTGTMHYAERLQIAIGDAGPLTIHDELTPIPGPHYRLPDGRFVLLGWSSTGAGMESLHAMLLRVRDRQVVRDQELIVTSDRPSAVLLIRREEDGIRIGIPEPSHQFIHSGDEWSLSAGEHCEPLDLSQIYKLTYVNVRPKAHDFVYAPPFMATPPPRRVTWIEITKKGFFWPGMRCRP